MRSTLFLNKRKKLNKTIVKKLVHNIFGTILPLYLTSKENNESIFILTLELVEFFESFYFLYYFFFKNLEEKRKKMKKKSIKFIT